MKLRFFFTVNGYEINKFAQHLMSTPIPNLTHIYIYIYRVIAEKTNAILRTKKPVLILGFRLLNFVEKTIYKEKKDFV
jgi:hypothetical protein